MKLSEWYNTELLIDGRMIKFITAVSAPDDGLTGFGPQNRVCLKLEIAPKYCYVADGNLYKESFDEPQLLEDYRGSVLPVEKYCKGSYENPQYLIACTVLPEQIRLFGGKGSPKSTGEQFQGTETTANGIDRTSRADRAEKVHMSEQAVQANPSEKSAESGKSNPQIGEILMQKGCISREQLAEAVEYQRNQGGRLGDILVALGYVGRQQIEECLPKDTKKLKIGELLVEKGYLSQQQLESALDFQKKSGGKLGEILLAMNLTSTEILFRELATQNKLGRVGKLIDFNHALTLPHEIARRYNAILVNSQNNRCLLAVSEMLSEAEINEIEAYLDMPVEQVLAANTELDYYWNIVYGERMADESINKLVQEQPENSALETFTKPQILFFVVLPVVTLVLYLLFGMTTLIGVNVVIQLMYFLMSVFKFRILLMGAKDSAQIRIGKDEVEMLDETKLPVYTILVPMYKEKEVIPRLIAHINALDYPKNKLDVRLLLEEDDTESVECIKTMNLPPYFTTIVVPHSMPKTKPKACNYGLIRARGKYVVIYDAEDRPDPDQLKKVCLTFEQLPDEYICVQAKLNYFNSDQNLLTKWFTQEYSMWFELLLPGVMELDIPIPLGGTSNHFKMEYLKKINAWDPYNVTEDADLGVRIFKDGYKTAVVDSRTWEEANSQVGNWLRQRSRWIKGYMQTWLVHMRNPFKLYKELGMKGFLGFQVMVLGTPLLTLLNPFFWFLVVVWYAFHPGWLEMLFPGGMYYIALIQLAIGNFIFIYANVLGTYWVIHELSIEKSVTFSYKLVKYALLTPLYWLLMSVAAFKAFGQLITKPFYWEKTHHGLTNADSTSILGSNLPG